MSENLGSGKQSAVSTRRIVPSSPLSTISRMRCGERVVPVVERLHHDEAGARRDRGHRFGFLGVRGERLLAQHVLARFERGDRPLGVQPVGQRVVDRVDVGIGEQRGVGVVHLRDAVLRRERLGAAAIARRDRDAPRLRATLRAGLIDRGRRDARRAEDADPNRGHPRDCI